MTAEQHRTPSGATAPASTRPNLTVITSCRSCGTATTRVLDRDDNPVIFDAGPDGKAVRDPYGDWWIARYREKWTVVKPAPGEDPPTTGGGARLREHDCGYDPAVAMIKAFFPGAEVIAVGDQAAAAGAAGGAMPVPKSEALIAEHGFRRPLGRGDGLRGAACVERLHLQQVPDPWAPPYPGGCVRCGRTTYRADLDGLAWCGGDVAWPELGRPFYPTST